MSQAPHCAHLRNGQKMGDLSFIDTMISDGLWDAFNGYHMGNFIENVAEKYQITREQQDEFAVASQQKAGAAMELGAFADEIVPVTIKTRKGEIVVDTDEHPKPDTSLDALSGLRPAFQKDGTVTADNASGINDGAAAIVLMFRSCGAARRRAAGADRLLGDQGCRPVDHGHGPDPRFAKALELAGWSTDDLDLIEANEAFAAQACAVNKGLVGIPRR